MYAVQTMYGSERFRRRITKLPKTHPDADEAQRIDLARDGFAGCLPGLPEEMVGDLFEYFHDRNAPLLQDDHRLGEYSARIGAVIDLFLGNYDHDADPLTMADWQFIRESIDAFALEMDMNTVNYIMALVVDKGAL